LLNILGVLAEFENEIRKAAGTPVKQLMTDYGISKDSIYRLTRPIPGK
jgi:hypothetical protein